MNKLKHLQGTQDLMKRDKSTKKMLQEQQRALKRGLLGKAEEPVSPQRLDFAKTNLGEKKKPSIRGKKIENLQQQQKEMKKKKPLKFINFY